MLLLVDLIVDHHCLEVIVRFVDIGGIVDHHCFEVIVRLNVDIGEIVDHHCLEVIVRFVDIGENDDHHYLEMIVRFVDISGIVDNHCLEMIVRLNVLFIINNKFKKMNEFQASIFKLYFRFPGYSKTVKTHVIIILYFSLSIPLKQIIAKDHVRPSM